MYKSEYDYKKQTILSNPFLTEVITKVKIIDEHGEDMIISKIEKNSPEGSVVMELSYTGSSKDWNVQAVSESLHINDVTININDVIVDPEEGEV